MLKVYQLTEAIFAPVFIRSVGLISHTKFSHSLSCGEFFSPLNPSVHLLFQSLAVHSALKCAVHYLWIGLIVTTCRTLGSSFLISNPLI